MNWILVYIQNDSKVLSGFLFIGHGNPDNNLESLCIYKYIHTQYDPLLYMKLKSNLSNCQDYYPFRPSTLKTEAAAYPDM
jgi:hypothetical protein